ncbi:hypothetical protein QYM36_000226 [Artemia franciscana]|uniref:Set1/Ash2 histone methyltransferase complex subunit ASH2-like winged-helix domain-containing protein n=1 Tax=Artemia franciscana TaxID=6661 RepID=A0AA88I7L9_ARTSF|nr:hypothetical protein QYM36_000226 [Artemia franciscana]
MNFMVCFLNQWSNTLATIFLSEFSHLCITAIANLLQISTKEGKPRQYFSKEREIIPFVDAHWESMTAMPRRATSSWHATVQGVTTIVERHPSFFLFLYVLSFPYSL